EAQASPDLVGQLIEWNLDLSQAESADERSQIFADQAAKLKAALQKTNLPPEDRELAETLWENGAWLAENEDPLAEADRFTAVADRLVEMMHTANKKGNNRALKRFAPHYGQVAENGIDANLEKIRASGVLDGERNRNLERIVRRNEKRRQALAELLERTPDASRKEIDQALGLGPKQKNPGARGKAPDKVKN